MLQGKLLGALTDQDVGRYPPKGQGSQAGIEDELRKRDGVLDV